MIHDFIKACTTVGECKPIEQQRQARIQGYNTDNLSSLLYYIFWFCPNKSEIKLPFRSAKYIKGDIKGKKKKDLQRLSNS